MYTELRMELDTNEITYQQSSNMQGVLMEQIDTGYAEQLHQNHLNPYSQHLIKENGKMVWYIKTVTDEAYENIIIPLSKMEQIKLKKKNITVIPTQKNIRKIETKELLEEFYETKAAGYHEISFLTPTAFKRDGRYVFYPDLRLVYGSLMRKYSEASLDFDMTDEEALEELCEKSEVINYRLQTLPFSLEKTRITGFTGTITIKIKGTETLSRYARLLFRFGEFSGIGIKTSMGMGAVKYGRRKNG